MNSGLHGYHGRLLEIDLAGKKTAERNIPEADLRNFIGGRGLGIKLLWDYLPKGGINPLSPENPLMFLSGPFSGFPIPSASRTCVVCKSPITSPVKSAHPHASTISYSNMGGFFGPEIRFAGYDGIVFTGRAEKPVYVVIEDDRVKIEDAGDLWGMGTDAVDKRLSGILRDPDFKTCYIGPAGENLVRYACIIHTAARAAGRGTGCVMGSKNLKAIAVKGSRMPEVADPAGFLEALEDARKVFKGFVGGQFADMWRKGGTAQFLTSQSKKGLLTTRNFQEGSFADADKIGSEAVLEKAWVRNSACYCCALSCKKSGVVRNGPYATLIHDGPEYETGAMFGSNLMISDFDAIMKAIYDGDDYGLDIISAGNVLGFLIEAREKGYMEGKPFGINDLNWGNADAAIRALREITDRRGIGGLAANGVRRTSGALGDQTAPFAMHVKGLELAAHNVQANPPKALCYATSNRGGCHLSGESAAHQNFVALVDSLGLCLFATDHNRWYFPGLGTRALTGLMRAITGEDWTRESLMAAGERVFNLEKLFNCREGFGRADDTVPERFFTRPYTAGPEEGAVLDREDFAELLDAYYAERGWDPETTRPGKETLDRLGLSDYDSVPLETT